MVAVHLSEMVMAMGFQMLMINVKAKTIPWTLMPITFQIASIHLLIQMETVYWTKKISAPIHPLESPSMKPVAKLFPLRLSGLKSEF